MIFPAAAKKLSLRSIPRGVPKNRKNSRSLLREIQALFFVFSENLDHAFLNVSTLFRNISSGFKGFLYNDSNSVIITKVRRFKSIRCIKIIKETKNITDISIKIVNKYY